MTRIEYTCSELPVFFKPDTAPVKTLTEVLKGPSASTTGSRFSYGKHGTGRLWIERESGWFLPSR